MQEQLMEEGRAQEENQAGLLTQIFSAARSLTGNLLETSVSYIRYFMGDKIQFIPEGEGALSYEATLTCPNHPYSWYPHQMQFPVLLSVEQKNFVANGGLRFPPKFVNEIFKLHSENPNRAVGLDIRVYPLLDVILYENYLTFEGLSRTEEIPQDRLIVLDNYAFDISDLMNTRLGKYALTFYVNPHLRSSKKHHFSEASKEIIRNHPQLGPCAENLRVALLAQEEKIQTATIIAIGIMLEEITDARMPQDILNAKIKFVRYVNTLSQDDQLELSRYYVLVKCENDNIDGARFDQMLINLFWNSEAFFWQLYVNKFPQAYAIVPPAYTSTTAALYRIVPSLLPALQQGILSVENNNLTSPNATLSASESNATTELTSAESQPLQQQHGMNP